MKQDLLTIAATLLIGAVAISAKAQAPVTLEYGVKGGVNLHSLILNDDFQILETKMKAGAEYSGFMRINIGNHFAVQPELEFYYRGTGLEATMGDATKSNKINQWGMQIPVYAMGKVKLGGGFLYGGVGPYVGLGISSKTEEIEYKTTLKDLPIPLKNDIQIPLNLKIDPIDLYEKNNDKSAMQRWDFGLACQLGYEFCNGIQVNVGYKYGFINQIDDPKTALSELLGKFNLPLQDASYRANVSVLTVGVGYRF